MSVIIQIFAAYIFIRILAVISDVGGGIFGDKLLIPSSMDARLAFFKKINDLDFAYHLTKKTGSLISAIKRGDNAFFELHFLFHWQILGIIVNFLIMLIFFSRLNVWLLLAMIISFTINALLSKKLIQKNVDNRKIFLRSDDRIMDIIADNLLNFETVKLFAKEKWELNRLRFIHKDWGVKFRKYSRTFRDIDATIGIFGNLGLFSILILGMVQVQMKILSVGDYIMVIGFMTAFYPRFFELLYQARHVVQATVDIEKYFGIFNEPIAVPDPKKPLRITSIKGDIEFKDVNFTYPSNKTPALKNFSLHIKPGQSIAFVGKSGVGKTTVGKLLLRFYDVQKGEVLLDGINIKKLKKDHLRSFIGVVPQEPILFNDTILYNIAYGKAGVKKQAIVAAAKMANLEEFIESLPKKYNTMVGERGVKLSGGQKQRLAIARMILSNPEIVIFDEATSQLDTESERQIQTAFWQAVKDKTTIIIAHRLSTIINADKIVVLYKGEIAEIGSHTELIQNPNSLYSHYWTLQTSSNML